MSVALLAGVGALLLGLGSMISAFSGMRHQKKRSEDECDRRISEYRKAFREGMSVEKRPKEEDEERWSHLP